MSKIITLTTDFGLTDEFVGVMKGVILARTPAARIVDLSHNIERHDIHQAGLLLKSAYRYFPSGTIHIVVVDPGVGGSRRLVLLRADNHFFLAPDNGVLGGIIENDVCQAAYEISCEQYYLSPVSATFHGRDILAPVAAELAAGLDPEAVGPAVDSRTLQKLAIIPAKINRQQSIIIGKIIKVDHFGNLQTNITDNNLHELAGERKTTVKIKVKNTVINGIASAYMNKEPGEILVIVNSRGYLEIAVNRGSAALILQPGPEEAVTVSY